MSNGPLEQRIRDLQATVDRLSNQREETVKFRTKVEGQRNRLVGLVSSLIADAEIGDAVTKKKSDEYQNILESIIEGR